MKKDKGELFMNQIPFTNNYLKMHGYAMGRHKGRRRHMSLTSMSELPFFHPVQMKQRWKHRRKAKCD